MSVEAGSAGISTGVPVGGVSSFEGGSSPSFSMGSMEGFTPISFNSGAMDASGGGLVLSPTMESLFSETTPFIASEGRVFDRAIGSPETVFSQKPDSMGTLFKDTALLKPVLESASERVSLQDAKEILGDRVKASSIDLREGEWTKVSDRNIEDLLRNTRPINPDIPTLDRKIDIDLSRLEVVAKNQTPEPSLSEDQQVEIAKPDLIQAQRVADVLISLGAERGEAEKHVLEILRKMNSKEEKVGSIVLENQDLNTQEESEEEATVVRKSIAVSVASEEEDQEDEEDDEEEKKKKKKKKNNKTDQDESVELALVVDELAQASRINSLKNRLSKAYQQAREKGMSVVRGRDVVEGLAEKKQDKSELLIQSGHENVSDGSFQEIADTISKVEFSNNVEADQDRAEAEVGLIVAGKPAIKISETITSKLASKDDEKRVMKFVNTPFPLAA